MAAEAQVTVLIYHFCHNIFFQQYQLTGYARSPVIKWNIIAIISLVMMTLSIMILIIQAARDARGRVVAAEGEHRASRALRHAAEVIFL